MIICCVHLKKVLRDDNIVTYQTTTKSLDENGFLYCYLPQGSQKYRVEFPFFCTLKLSSGQTIHAICVQVPPFFCILPHKRGDADILQRSLQYIVKNVQCTLDKALEDFIAATNAKARRIEREIEEVKNEYERRKLKKDLQKPHSIIQFHDALTDNGYVLFFRYFPLKKPIEVTVHVPT